VICYDPVQWFVLRAGITSDEMGQHCIFCDFMADDYDVPVKHDPNCPVLAAQQIVGKGTLYWDANKRAWYEKPEATS